MRFRAAGRRPRRRRDRRAQLSPRRRPRGPPRRHRAGRQPTTAKRAAALSAIIAGRDVTLHGEDDTPDRYGRQPAFVFLAGAETPVQSDAAARKARRWFRPTSTDKDCAADLPPPRPTARQAKRGNLGRSGGHKKRGKSGRYFGRDWALYGGRRQGFVRAAGRGNDLPEFRPELDTGLCCDYFKAHDAGVRGGRDLALSPSKIERIRVRGWVEARGGPRIEVLRVGQIELLGEN